LGATGVIIVNVVVCSPIGWVLVPTFAAVGVLANGFLSFVWLVRGKKVEIPLLWRTYYGSIAMCFTACRAYKRSKKYFSNVRISDVHTAEELQRHRPFTNPTFRSFVGWICDTFSADRRYDEANSGLKRREMGQLTAGDEVHKSLPGIECRMSPFTMSRDELNVPCGEEITGVRDDDGSKRYRPVVIWIDGTKNFSDKWQCIMNLCGCVPPKANEYYRTCKERLARIKEVNKDNNTGEILVPIFAGHSAGGMFASAIAAKLHCGAIGINDLGIGEGMEKFIGKDGMKWANEHRAAFISLAAKSDHTSDPYASAMYRTHFGRTIRFMGDNFYHFNYQRMLGAYGCTFQQPQPEDASVPSDISPAPAG
jgi:hypothetical protein